MQQVLGTIEDMISWCQPVAASYRCGIVHLNSCCSWHPGFLPCRRRLIPLDLCQKILAPPDEVVISKLPQIGI